MFHAKRYEILHGGGACDFAEKAAHILGIAGHHVSQILQGNGLRIIGLHIRDHFFVAFDFLAVCRRKCLIRRKEEPAGLHKIKQLDQSQFAWHIPPFRFFYSKLQQGKQAASDFCIMAVIWMQKVGQKVFMVKQRLDHLLRKLVHIGKFQNFRVKKKHVVCSDGLQSGNLMKILSI